MKKEKKVVINEVVVVETKQKGRPVDVNSVRQKRLKELEEKRIKGELKRGRPGEEDSARQKRIKELEDKRVKGELKLGRPVNEDSARQKRLAELAARAEANGGVVKRGRPAKVEIDETAS